MFSSGNPFNLSLARYLVRKYTKEHLAKYMHYITYSLYYILEQPVSYISSAYIFKSTRQNMFV